MIVNRVNNHWAFDYLGKRWESGKQGPDAYDCWSLVRAINKSRYNRDLPEIIINANDTSEIIKTFSGHEEFNRWQLVDVPTEGDCVITKSSPENPEHIGIWIDVGAGRVLQCVYGAGVIAISLEATRKMIGQHIEFWRYRELIC